MSTKKLTWTLLFQHLPKAGGTTLSHIILQHFARKDVFHIRSHQHAKAPIYSESWGPVEEFVALSASERSRYRCLLGHMRFGIHEYIPHVSKYVTMLRDPLERVLSQHGQYNRMVANNEIPYGRIVSLDEFLRLKKNTAENHQTRFLTYGDFDEMTDQERLEQAKANMDGHYFFVGVMERFDESVLVLNKKMRWPNLPYVRQNVGTSRLSVDQYPPDLIDLIREKNPLDYELHSHSGQLLDEAIVSYEGDFQGDLAALRKANQKERMRKPGYLHSILITRWRSLNRRLHRLR